MSSTEYIRTTIKLYKYRKSGETLAKIIARRTPITNETRKNIIEFVIDLARADELVERISSERDPEIRRSIYREKIREFVLKYTNNGYSGVFSLFQADLKWNRRRDVKSSIELSKEIYRFITDNITHVYDRDVENLIIVSNLLDDLFDIWKDRRFSISHIIELMYSITTYSLASIGILLKNITLLGELVVNVKYIFRGGFEDERFKNMEIEAEKIRY